MVTFFHLGYHSLDHQQCPFEDPATDDLMERYKSRFWKQYWSDVKTINEHVYEEDQGIVDLYRLIGVVPQEPKAIKRLQVPRRPPSCGKADKFSSGTVL